MLTSVAAGIFAASLACLILPVFSEQWTLVWEDEFNGPTIDQTKWGFNIGDGCPTECNWGNEELEFYKEENAWTEDGHLVIEARKEAAGTKQYTSTRMRTKGKGDWTFGKIEVRARIAGTQGIWPAIWMLPTNSKWPWPKNGEIDIMESVGKDPYYVYMTAHYGNSNQDVSRSGGNATLPVGQLFKDDFHVYGIEWRKDEIQWFVDGKLKLTVTESEVRSKGYTYPFNDQKFHLLLNVAVGGKWPGSPNATTVFPQQMLVDYVKVYEWQ